jgi:hypothetical protein
MPPGWSGTSGRYREEVPMSGSMAGRIAVPLASLLVALLAVAVPPAPAGTGPPPDLTVDPAAGEPGTDVRVSGSGLCCSEDADTVPIVWGAFEEVGTATIYPDGTVEGEATIPDDAEEGPDTLEVCESAIDDDGTTCVSGSFEVVASGGTRDGTADPTPAPPPDSDPDPTPLPPVEPEVVVPEPPVPEPPDVGTDPDIDDPLFIPSTPVTEESEPLVVPWILVAAVGAVAIALLARHLHRRLRARRGPPRVVLRPDQGVQTLTGSRGPALAIGAGLDLSAGVTLTEERRSP